MTLPLRDRKYSVTAGRDDELAPKLPDGPQQAFDVLTADMVMPKVSGRDVAKTVFRPRPTISMTMISGYSRGKQVRLELKALANKFLENPHAGRRSVSLIEEIL